MSHGRLLRNLFKTSNLLTFVMILFILNFLFFTIIDRPRDKNSFLSSKNTTTPSSPLDKFLGSREGSSAAYEAGNGTEKWTPQKVLPSEVSAEVQNLPPIFILWSRWRRGSSFLGKLLAYARSNTFYSYEPLHALGLTVFGRNEPASTRYGVKVLFDFMGCRYDLHRYLLKYFLETEFYFFYNPLTKRKCKPITTCSEPSILNELCINASAHVIKLLRLNLDFGKYFLKKNPRIKIIYLVRDPRGTLKSRSRLMWCLLTKDCHNPASVCQTLQDEIDHSFELRRQYPDRFFFLRYEDLALNPKSVFKALWSDLGQEFTPRIERMIDKHTTVDLENGTYGLKKVSRRKVFSWRSSLDYKSMIKIQDNCESPMNRLGYHVFADEEEYENQSVSALISEWKSPLSRYNIEYVNTPL